jgi:hypothetical protein
VPRHLNTMLLRPATSVLHTSPKMLTATQLSLSMCCCRPMGRPVWLCSWNEARS